VTTAGDQQPMPGLGRWVVDQVAQEQDGIELAGAQIEAGDVGEHGLGAAYTGEHRRLFIDTDHAVPARNEGVGDAADAAAEIQHRRPRGELRGDDLDGGARVEATVELDGAAVRCDHPGAASLHGLPPSSAGQGASLSAPALPRRRQPVGREGAVQQVRVQPSVLEVASLEPADRQAQQHRYVQQRPDQQRRGWQRGADEGGAELLAGSARRRQDGG
jgi:hypothetical protein